MPLRRTEDLQSRAGSLNLLSSCRGASSSRPARRMHALDYARRATTGRNRGLACSDLRHGRVRAGCRLWHWALLLFATLVLLAAQRPAAASTLPSGFRDTVALSGLTNPTVVQFASDGRIFVGQKNGVIKVFRNLTDTAPVTFADLSSSVHDFWDRGLLAWRSTPTSPPTPMCTSCMPTTRRSAVRHRRGGMAASPRQARRPTAALCRGGCRGSRPAATR
jgi:hypothetical protein